MLLCVFTQVWMNVQPDFGCRLMSFLKAFTIPLSAQILVVIAVDRFLLICFLPSKKLNYNLVRAIIGFVIIFATILSVPHVLTHGTIIHVEG